jgi:hypothetical protein
MTMMFHPEPNECSALRSNSEFRTSRPVANHANYEVDDEMARRSDVAETRACTALTGVREDQ